MSHFLKNKMIHDAVLLVYRGQERYIDESKGEMTNDSPFAIASISKLYTYTLVLQLIDAGQLSYQTHITDILPPHITEKLPHAKKVTIRHLLDQTSGFANYEMDHVPGKPSLMDEILQHDRRVEFDELLEILAKLPLRSELGGKRAYYADINAMLLGKIAELITGETAKQLLVKRICQPLGLVCTHWANGDEVLAPLYNGRRTFAFQKYLSSQVYQGGIVTTSRELMRFIQGFFGGKLFDTAHISDPTFRPIQFRPLKYGSGMMQLSLMPIVSCFFGGVREIRGHSGITGSFAFYYPEKKVFVTGTVNQLKYRPYPMIFQAISSAVKKRR